MEYTLSNGMLTLGFTTLGGTFTSIKEPEGRERLWQPDPAVWTGQAPICFPVCGGLRDGKATTLSGKQVALARHGFARKQEFQLVLHSDRDITFALESTPTLLEQYPFPFHFESHYALEGPTVRVTYATTNTGSEPMPFFIGGHPAFRVPVLPGERYEDYRVVFEKDESRTVPTPEVDTGLIDVEHRLEAPQHGRVLAITHELFDPAETIYDTLESRAATLENADGSLGVRLTFPKFPYLIVWSKPAGDFVAVEPWGGLSTCSDEDDVLEHKRGCLVAQPGETIEREFTIEVF